MQGYMYTLCYFSRKLVAEVATASVTKKKEIMERLRFYFSGYPYKFDMLISFLIGCFVMNCVHIIISLNMNNYPDDLCQYCSSTLEYQTISFNKPLHIPWNSLNLSKIEDRASARINSTTTIDNDKSGRSLCFDYDDTIVFTTPIFEFAKTISAYNKNNMWDIINDAYISTRFSINKNITSLILQNYVNRASNTSIRIIISRCSSSLNMFDEDEASIQRQIATIIPHATNLRVYMSCDKYPQRMSKFEAMRHFGCRIMFGNSDESIHLCTLLKNCSPLRILRSKNSTSTSTYNPGFFNELIISNSDY
uniref:AphA protein n=1 Tax=Fopius arisanus TaxID=64838 RepID=A0A0C9PNG1_9HYME